MGRLDGSIRVGHANWLGNIVWFGNAKWLGDSVRVGSTPRFENTVRAALVCPRVIQVELWLYLEATE